MKASIRVVASLVLIWPLLGQAAKPEIGTYPKIFESGNYTVTMLRLGKDDSSVLIKVTGIDNEFDGQIYKHSKICENTPCTTFKYETAEIPGKKRWWTLQSTRPWGDHDEITLFPPGIDKRYQVQPRKAPEGFDGEKFYQEYLGQQALRK